MTPLIPHFDLLATAPGGVARLRELILTLAVQGKLVPQDPTDEPASVLLQRIRAEKDRLIAAGKIKRDKPHATPDEEEQPFDIPFSWEWVHFGDLVVISGGVTLGRKIGMTKPISLPYLRVANVQRWRLDLNTIKDVVIDESELDRYQLMQGDLLITEGGDWDKVGRTAIWRNQIATCLHQNHVFKARGLGNAWNSAWAELYLNSPVARNYFAASAKQTTNLASINMAELRGCVFPLPPLAEQSRIVTRVEELMRLCDALEQQRQLETAQHAQLLNTLLGTLTDCTSPDELAANWQRVSDHFDLLLDRPEAVDALEQTVLQLAVRGLLVPQDPADEPASVLLQRIREEKDRLISAGKIKRDKPLAPIRDEEISFDAPHGWEWIRLGHVASRVQYGFTASADHSIQEPKFLRITDIQDDKVNWETVPGVNSGSQDISGYFLEGGDLLIARTGGTIGKSFLVPPVPVKSVFASYLIRVSPIIGLDPRFLKIFASSQLYWKQLYAHSMGTGQPNVNGTALSELILLIPPLPEQTRIVARVTQLRDLCTTLRQRLTAGQTTQRHLAEALVEV